MGRIPVVPVELTRGPFDLEAAMRVGITKQQLRGAAWRRLGAGMYSWSAVADDPMTRLVAVSRRLPFDAVFSGRTAAWLLGIDVRPCSPIEVTLPAGSCISRISGVTVRRSDVAEAEVAVRRGLRITSRVRTFADLGRREPTLEALTVIDMAAHRRLVSREALRRWAAAHAGYRGIERLRQTTDLVEPGAESPMETRLRLLLIEAGLPRPRVQVSLCDHGGQFVGRPDLYYPLHRLAIEYDGDSHRESLAADNRRQNRLIDAGYRLLRFSASDVFSAPESVVALVRRSLSTC